MVNDRLKMILTHEEISRFKVSESNPAHIKIVADVHGMKCYQARRFISNIINAARVVFKLIIIHGYKHGTTIKDMLAENFSNNHIYDQFPDTRNQGVTHMLIAA